ncbi:NADH-quinone oxidoreductase subunit C [Helicobacter turcicus]|uniref:NADH-quinone oxidoreductase n=1 Tax=Helicobacter turcicus TaxID=2867412 RepID=A0ABS7JL94_9HELI|nr:NADH-quinone oxidoreductase subunit C [Helicobacter turcicus]MBX7490150.1 NADH-quinone oxidoreductase subunit C [Helicobacter turcicus]MBX7545008.1 NADH-quinone oxidoreductase subunit C [Helicobacter turcicus]
MREYKPKKNAQKSVNYKDRFYVSPRIPRESVESDGVYLSDVQTLQMQVKIMESYIERGTLVIWVEKDEIFRVLEILKSMSYDVLSELSAMDYLESKGGFEIFYQMLSLQKAKRLRVKTFLKKGERIESVSTLFSSANWSEREMYDMFGILPLNHPYPKRILMPDDWVGHPLLKSYPLQGDEMAQWYEVDTIFGKEYRGVIGPEQRDSARVDRYDSKRFSHLGYEVGYGEEVKENKERARPIMYQEEDGVLFVTKLKPELSKELKERK